MTGMTSEIITLGGGCFWCTEAVYEQVRGVLAVESGYCNGHVLRPTYEQVCQGDTGHAEVVRVTFDPQTISLREVLEIFFATHDPTTLNRQGHDVGPQYRSGIYLEHESQRDTVQRVWSEAQKAYQTEGRQVVTEIQSLSNYSRAEDYHQHYFALHPGQGYCAHVIAPKLDKFRKTFKNALKH
jgi:peptide-methionine (S)-S-oxide reductase